MFLLQHGYGRRPDNVDLLEDTFDQGWSGGIILGAGEESPASLRETAQAASSSGAQVFVDPQLYILSIQDGNTKRLDRYDWFPRRGNLVRLSPSEVIRIVRAALDFQQGLGLTTLIAPTPILTDIDSSGASLFHLFASQAVEEERGELPLFLTLVVEEHLLGDWEYTRRLLDFITTYEVDGFYLIISHRAFYHPLRWDPGTLSRAGLVVSQLASEHNNYRVIVGYSGLTGFFFRCLGAEGFASGWSNSLQRFHISRWEPGGFSLTPLARFVSPTAFGNLLVVEQVIPLIEETSSPYDPEPLISGVIGSELRALSPDRYSQWSNAQFRRSHFETCNALEARVASGSLSNRISSLIEVAQEAIDLFANARGAAPIQWLHETGPRHLQVWQAAATELAGERGISL